MEEFMARLKSRVHFVPGQFQYLVPEIAQPTPFTGSFDSVVQQVYDFRARNTYLCRKYNWSLNRIDIENDVEQANVQRCLASGWTDFLILEDSDQSLIMEKKTQPWSHRAAAGLKRAADAVKSGAGIWRDLFGPEGKMVSRDQAEARAKVCVACPLNKTEGGLGQYFVETLVAQIQSVYGTLHDLNLHTSLDDKLGVCEACSCPTKAKVWPATSYILAHTKPEVKARLHPDNPECWILTEEKSR